MVCLALPIFLGDASQTRIGLQPQEGRDDHNLELAALLAKVYIFATKMHTLANIRTAVDNTAEQGWVNHRSDRSATAVGPILRDLALLTWKHKIYSSVQRIAGADNKMDDATSPEIFFCNISHSPSCRKILCGCSPFRQGEGSG